MVRLHIHIVLISSQHDETVTNEQDLSKGSERVPYLYKGDMLWIVNCNDPHHILLIFLAYLLM